MKGVYVFWIGLIAVAAGSLALGGPAAGQTNCVVMRSEAGNTVLHNTCGVCRLVKVEHRRPGASFPIGRDYPIPAEGRAQLSFRGGGQTRVVSELACPGARNEDAQNVSRGPECVVLRHTEQTGPVAVNICADCRIAEVERRAVDGEVSRFAVGINGRSYVPMRLQGAEPRLLGDRPCR